MSERVGESHHYTNDGASPPKVDELVEAAELIRHRNLDLTQWVHAHKFGALCNDLCGPLAHNGDG